MIIDASVAMKWLIEETDSNAAKALIVRPDLEAPNCLAGELGNALARMTRQGRVSEPQARMSWAEIPMMPVSLVDWSPFADEGFNLSLVLGVAFYDCLYLALALRQDDSLVTADARFVRAVQSRPALHGRAVLLSDL